MELLSSASLRVAPRRSSSSDGFCLMLKLSGTSLLFTTLTAFCDILVTYVGSSVMTCWDSPTSSSSPCPMSCEYTHLPVSYCSSSSPSYFSARGGENLTMHCSVSPGPRCPCAGLMEKGSNVEKWNVAALLPMLRTKTDCLDSVLHATAPNSSRSGKSSAAAAPMATIGTMNFSRSVQTTRSVE